MIQQQAQSYLQPTNPDPATMSPQDAQTEIATNLTAYAGGGPDAAAAKERIVNIMAAQMKVSHEQTQTQIAGRLRRSDVAWRKSFAEAALHNRVN